MIKSLQLAVGTTLLLASALCAQAPVIHINSQVWDGNGGPFLAGTVYHIISNGGGCCMSVPAGQTLTMQPGAMVKIDGAIHVHGHLDARGVIFTSWEDDSIGGDSNNNGGATTPARGDWSIVELNGTALIEDCKFRYGGRGGKSVYHRNGTMTMRRCVVEHSLTDALLIGQADCIVTDSKFRQSGGIAINGMALRYIPQLLDNTATNCDGGDYVRITNGVLNSTSGATVINRRSSLNQSGVLVLHGVTNVVSIQSGASLAVSKGMILKFEHGRFHVSQDLLAQGTAAEPIVFTSLEDDSFGGDTNKDGNATQPAPGDWRGIIFQVLAGASRMENAIVRFGGSTGSEGAGVAIHGSAVEVRDCVIDANAGAGVYFRGAWTGYPRLVGCSITNNGTEAGKYISWQSLELSSGNTASGNGGGDHFIAYDYGSSSPIEVGPRNYPGDVLVLEARTTLNNGGELDLRAGTILKFTNTSANGILVSQKGALRVHGTSARPVIMTSIHDDTAGGDTNGNGNATVPQAGQWRQLSLNDDRVTSPSLLENLVVRYAGNRSYDAVRIRNPKLTCRSIRIEHVAARGLDVANLAGNLENLVVWDAATDGIRISGGSFDILHATVVGCGGLGINQYHSIYSGVVRSSIVWNNTAGNFGGLLTASDVHNSNGGFASVNGNIMQAPQFVSEATGDFHLSASSPCLGRGDLVAAIATRKDHDEHSRVLDPTFSGIAMPDMGAFERWAYRLKATGLPAVGGTMTFSVEGPAGMSTVFLGFLNGGFFLPPFGVELAGSTLFFLANNAVPVGQALSMTIPNDQALVGLKFGVQGLGLSQAHALRGGFTNLYRGRVDL